MLHASMDIDHLAVRAEDSLSAHIADLTLYSWTAMKSAAATRRYSMAPGHALGFTVSTAQSPAALCEESAAHTASETEASSSSAASLDSSSAVPSTSAGPDRISDGPQTVGRHDCGPRRTFRPARRQRRLRLEPPSPLADAGTAGASRFVAAAGAAWSRSRSSSSFRITGGMPCRGNTCEKSSTIGEESR